MKKILLFLPVFVFAGVLMHPDDPKSRDHNSLGFGVSGDVAISEGVFFIGQTGSSLNNGSVYIYSPNALNGLDQDEIMAPIQNELGFDFGYALAVDGNWMIVGAPHRAQLNGRAFLYQRSEDGDWRFIQTFEPRDGNGSNDYGSKVAISNGHILVGDRYMDEERGAVFTYFYDSQSNKWSNNGVIKYSGMGPDGYFGHDLSIEGDKAIVGTRNGNTAVYYQFENDNWQEKQALTPDRYQSKGRFGFSVSIHGNILAVGYPGYDQKGLITIYHLNGDSWSKKQTLTNPDEVVESYFGSDIALEDNYLVTGHYNGEKAFLYINDGQSFNLKNGIESPVADEGKFGRSLAIKGDQMIIGATYGQKAHIYRKNENDNWSLAHAVSSDNRTRSVTGKKIDCEKGKSGDYDCNSINMMAFVSPSDLSGGTHTELNDIWGWTDSTTSKEYALVGLRMGTSFVDVTDPVNPFVVGFLPTAKWNSTWRDMKVYKDHVYIVADNAGSHGVQVFDLTQLRGDTTFTNYKMTYHYTNLGSAHNIAINEATGFAYATGISSAPTSEYRCDGGLHMMDLSDPALPTFAGCFAHSGTGRSETGYTHDAQIVIYNGPDKDHKGKEIAFSSNETALSIADVTDKSNPIIISKFDNKQFGYVHQGWLTENHQYFFVNDELNEYYGYDEKQTTVIFDLTDLDQPEVLTIYNSNLKTIDHNNYVVGDLLYQSNYSSGLRVLNIKNVHQPIELAFFDTYLSGNRVSFVGSWSNYPYFSSGTLLVSSIEEGLYILKVSEDDNLTTDKENVIPEQYALNQNYPNPFNPSTQIQYELPMAGEIILKVYNMLGMEVAQIDNGFKSAGIHHATFDGSKLPSGIYFYQLRAGHIIKTRKMSLIK